MAKLNLPSPTAYTGQKSTIHQSGAARFATPAEVAEGVMNDVMLSPADLAAGLVIQAGAVTDPAGSVTLVAGTATVANTNIQASDKIFLQRHGANASTTLGMLDYAITAGTSFTINSLIVGTPGSVETDDLSTVEYMIVHTI